MRFGPLRRRVGLIEEASIGYLTRVRIFLRKLRVACVMSSLSFSPSFRRHHDATVSLKFHFMFLNRV